MISIFSKIFGKKPSKLSPISSNDDDDAAAAESSPQKNKVRVPSVSMSVENLNTQQDFLTRRISLLERQIEEKRTLLKAAVERGDKTKAKFILSDIKKKESETIKLSSQLANLETIEKALNEARLQKEISKAIESATKTLKNEKVCVEDVEKVMDEAQDLIDSQQEASDVLSRRLVNGNTFQEDEEIEAELNCLFDGMATTKSTRPVVDELPLPLQNPKVRTPLSEKSSSSVQEKENLLALLEA